MVFCSQLIYLIMCFLVLLFSIPLSAQPDSNPQLMTEVWLTEGFEEELFPPAGWTRYNMQGSAREWVRTTAFTHTGEGAALHQYDANEYQEGWLVTPLISLGSNSTLTFWDYTLNPAWYVYSGIWISTGSPDPADGDYVEFIELDDGTHSWTQRNIDISDYDGDDVYIAFLYEGLDAHSWYVDDIYIYGASEAPGPAVVVSPEDGADMVLVSASLMWEQTMVGPDPTGYKINFGTDYPPGNIEDNTDLGYNTIYTPVAPLDYATTYYWQIVPYNADGESPENPVWSFTTGPEPTLIPPHVENFNNVSTPDLPYMWSKIVEHTSTVAVVRTTTQHSPNSPPNHVEIHNSFTADPDGVLMLIPPPLAEFEGHAISFYAKSNATGTLLVIGTISDPDDGETFSPVDTLSLSTGYTGYMLNLDMYDNSDDYIAFLHGESGAGNGRRILIDDFAYYELTPYPGPALVVHPEDGAENVLPSTQLEWSPGPGEEPDGYKISFGTDYPPTNIEHETDLGNTTVYVPSQNLEPNTVHYWQITPYNAEGEPSNVPVWSFTTGPDPMLVAPHVENFDDVTPPELPYGWDKIVIHSNPFAAVRTTYSFSPNSHPVHAEIFNTFYSDPGEAHLLLITPPLQSFGGHQIRFYAKTASATTFLEVGTIADPGDPATFTAVDSIDLTTTYTEYTLPLTPYANGDQFLAFRHGEGGEGDGKRILLDDFVYEESDLPLPDKVILDDPGDGEAIEVPDDNIEVLMVWYASQPEVTNYQLDIANDSDFSDIIITDDEVADTFYVFTGIEDNETYYWRVRAENESGWGPYSEVWSFTTIIVGVDNIEIPAEYTLLQNYPNPFNPSTVIRYGLPERSSVKLEIYNTLGQRIATLVNTELEAGYHEIEWYSGRAASGMYFYRLEAQPVENPSNRFVDVRTMLLLK